MASRLSQFLQPEAEHLLTYLLSYLLSYLFTYLVTYSMEKLTGSQLIKIIPAFYGTRRFITPFTSARHLSLSWASLIQSTTPQPSWYYPAIYAWVLQVVSFPQVPHRTPIYTSPLTHTRYMPHPSHSSRLDHLNNIVWRVKIIKLLTM